MTVQSLTALALVLAMATLAPFISDRLTTWILVPSVVLELVLGVLTGPSVLGWVKPDVVVSAASGFGLAMLMFLAGYEIDFGRIRGAPIKRAVIGWGISVVLGLIAGLLVRGFTLSSLVIGLALTTTALGTILPMVRDAGVLGSPFGARVLAVGAVGEFGPIVAVALVLTSRQPIRTTVLMIGFAVLAVVAARLAMLPRHPLLARLVTATLGSSVQLAVRLVMLAVVLMLLVTTSMGLDMLLGAFAAGIVVRLALEAGDPDEAKVVESKLEGIAFGFFVPVFFVMSGVQLDLAALVADPVSLLFIPAVVVLFLLVRGVPTYLLNRDEPLRRPLALFASTALPLVVVITSAGVDDGALKPSTAAAMVAAGVISVLIFPMLALRASALLTREYGRGV